MAKLSATDRKDVRKLMEDKEKQLTQALGKEISSDINQIQSRLLMKSGYQVNSKQAHAHLSNLKEQREKLIQEIDSSEQSMELDVKEAAFEKDYQEKMTAMQIEFEQKKQDLYAWRDGAKKDLEAMRKNHMQHMSDEKESFNNEYMKKNYPNILEQIEEASEEYSKICEFEKTIKPEAHRIAQVTQQSQSRLQFLVSEATIKAKQDLLSAQTYEDAVALIESIPSVSELIEIMEDPTQGAVGLVNRLNPQFQIALPAPTEPHSREQSHTAETETEVEKEIVVSVSAD